jgi:death on curing protein
MFTLTADLVVEIHDEVLNDGELPGLAKDKSLEGALGRVDNRVVYGLISDVFDLAAAYAMAIAQGHCFNDGNKRTAYRALQVCLEANEVSARYTAEQIGPMIILAAQRKTDEGSLAEWLREHV